MRMHVPRRGRVGFAPIVFACALMVLGCRPPAPHGGSAPWLVFDWPEADALFQRDRFWLGGDGAYSIDLGAGRVLWLFGDSWIDPKGTGDRDGAAMISNSVAVQRGYDPARAEAAFYWGSDGDGAPQAFFADSGAVRFWPGHGVHLGERLLLFLMAVHPADSGLGFEVAGWKAVLVSNPNADPVDWQREWLDAPANEHGIIVGSGGVLLQDGYVYAFGAQEPGPAHDVSLARWTIEDVLGNRLAKIMWWAGDALQWRPDPEGPAEAKPVFTNGQTEFTVHRDPVTGRFLQFQTLGFGAAALVRREASALSGPWSAPDTVFVPAQNTFPRVMVYQGKAHPHLDGADLVATYCTNSFEFADHLTEPWLYFPRFVRLNAPNDP